MDNTEGSRVIFHIFRARKNLELRLSSKQMAIVLGSILGDAYIHPQGKICFEHAEKQQDYLFWKFSQLKTLAYPKVAKVTRWDKRTYTQTVSWRFFLRQFFRPLRNAFYLNNKKVIPLDLKSWISPQLLAVWYMDDGHLAHQKYPTLMTESFNSKELELLSQMLENTLHIKCSVTNKRRLRIQAKSIPRFFQLIEHYIHPSMRYKLP